MEARLAWEQAGERIYVLVLAAGEEAFATIVAFAESNDISGASLTGIGAFEHATVGWFDLKAKTYRPKSAPSARR